MIPCLAPHPSQPAMRCAAEAGHAGPHWMPNPGNASRHEWPAESWPRWRSVKDEPPPEKMSHVLIFHDDAHRVVRRRFLLINGQDLGITHWMPLPPSPPKGTP